jgi:hypothetical protein
MGRLPLTNCHTIGTLVTVDQDSHLSHVRFVKGVLIRDEENRPYSDKSKRAVAWFLIPINTDWAAEHRLAIQEGRVVIAETRIYPAVWNDAVPEDELHEEDDVRRTRFVPRGGLTTRILRAVPTGAHVDNYQEVVNALRKHGKMPAALGIVTVHAGGRSPSRAPGVSGRGRKPLPADVLAAAASAYITARKTGHRAPVIAAAKALGINQARMRDWLYRARRHDPPILTPTYQGRGGGDLTAEGKKLLKQTKTTRRTRGKEGRPRGLRPSSRRRR